MSRKLCSDCPYRKNSINKNFAEYVIENYKNGLLPTIVHRCHKISKDTYGESNDENVCIGSKIKIDKIK